MLREFLRPIVIVTAVVVLLALSAREFTMKRRALQASFTATPTPDPSLDLARRQALQSLSIEQLLHMIHTMLAAILVALLWR
jgi:hypothetical protein